VLGIGVIIAAASVTFVAVATIKERYRGDLHQTCEAEAGETVA
jgi:hypothetical protein